MFETLSADDISNALTEMITCFGVKEDMPSDGLVAFLRKKDTEGCVKEIAIRERLQENSGDEYCRCRGLGYCWLRAVLKQKVIYDFDREST
jgi:hypothetical protein